MMWCNIIIDSDFVEIPSLKGQLLSEAKYPEFELLFQARQPEA